MKVPPFAFILLGLPASGALAAFRPDIKGRVEVAELGTDQVVTEDTTQVAIRTSRGSDLTVLFECTKDNKELALSADGHFVGCCLPGQHLSGSEQSAFDCCGRGHEIAGDAGTGYICCPTGFMYDGSICKPDPGHNGGGGQQQINNDYGNPGKNKGNGDKQQQLLLQQEGGEGGRGMDGFRIEKTCANGKRLVNGECVCAEGQLKEPCTSGIETGKCYTFKHDNGHLIGYTGGYYGPGYDDVQESAVFRNGLFTLCHDEDCKPGLPIDPPDGIRIKDLHGFPGTGANPGQWLNNAKNGDHITKTPDYNQAGVFTLTKWPCGRYCLGGVDLGVIPTCPSNIVGSTFTSLDLKSCVTITLQEVPCNPHCRENNCLWEDGDQC